MGHRDSRPHFLFTGTMKRLFIFIIALLVAAPCFGEGSVAIPVSPFDPRGNLRDIADEPDPEEDKLWFFDVTDGKVKLVTLGTNLSISGTTLNASGGGGGVATSTPSRPIRRATATSRQPTGSATWGCRGCFSRSTATSPTSPMAASPEPKSPSPTRTTTSRPPTSKRRSKSW